MKLLSRAWLFATPWTAAYQAPPSIGFFQARVLEWVAIALGSTLTTFLYHAAVLTTAIMLYIISLVLIFYLEVYAFDDLYPISLP